MTIVLQNPYSKIDRMESDDGFGDRVVSFWVHDPRYPTAPLVVSSFGAAIYMAMVHTLQQNGEIY